MYAENEIHLGEDVHRAILVQDAPFLLIGDFSIDPVYSSSISTAIIFGLLVDVGKELREGKSPQPTL